MQATIGHLLTGHRTGGQSRAFFPLQDTVRCMQLAIPNPPEEGSRVRVFNRMTEVHRVRELAKLVSRMTGADIDYVDSPRNEADSDELLVENEQPLSWVGTRSRSRRACWRCWRSPRTTPTASTSKDPVPIAVAAQAVSR